MKHSCSAHLLSIEVFLVHRVWTACIRLIFHKSRSKCQKTSDVFSARNASATVEKRANQCEMRRLAAVECEQLRDCSVVFQGDDVKRTNIRIQRQLEEARSAAQLPANAQLRCQLQSPAQRNFQAVRPQTRVCLNSNLDTAEAVKLAAPDNLL